MTRECLTTHISSFEVLKKTTLKTEIFTTYFRNPCEEDGYSRKWKIIESKRGLLREKKKGF